jgi:ketol-acid reductoisomerase
MAIFTEQNASPQLLAERRLALVGYGELGRAFALNLRDSGQNVLIGLRDSDNAEQVSEDGFETLTADEACRNADFKLLLSADEDLAKDYMTYVSPSLRNSDVVAFASGYGIGFGLIEPPPFVDAVMIAPRILYQQVRQAYSAKQGFPSFVGVGQDATGKAWDAVLALAWALGGLRQGALAIELRQEAELRLFMQQAVLPAIQYLMLTAVDLLSSEGYPSEAALLDLYITGELSAVMNQAAALSLDDSLDLYSRMGQYGFLSRADRFIDPNLRRRMEHIIDDIRKGRFTHEWSSEMENQYPRLLALQQRRKANPLWLRERETLQLLRRTIQTPPQEDSW